MNRSSYDDDSDVTETLTILVGGPDAGILPFALRGSSSIVVGSTGPDRPCHTRRYPLPVKSAFGYTMSVFRGSLPQAGEEISNAVVASSMIRKETAHKKGNPASAHFRVAHTIRVPPGRSALYSRSNGGTSETSGQPTRCRAIPTREKVALSLRIAARAGMHLAWQDIRAGGP